MFDKEELRRKLMARLGEQKQMFATRSMHFLERPLKAGMELAIGPHKYPVAGEAFLVVIDEAPGAFWTHPVRYELHEVKTGEVHVIQEEFPLEQTDLQAELVALHIPDLPHLKKKDERDKVDYERPPINWRDLEKRFETLTFAPPSPCVATRHALFVAGMDNMPHFHTDFVIMRDVLIERYGYDPANIVLVMGDGTGYWDLPVDYAGTVAGLDAALDDYAPGGTRALGPDDSLFLFTFNHGGWDGTNAYLCMAPSWDNYYDYQLKAKLNAINCGRLLVAMNQCHSGGFIHDVVTSTGPNQVFIMTACDEHQSAYPTAVGSHGYLVVALYTGLNWAFPAAISPTFPGYVAGDIAAHDTNSDGMISAEEAWHYVHDMMHANHAPTISGIETPQWGESSVGVGATLFWGQPDLVVEDGTPVWESPDVYLHDPAVVPTDATVVVGHPANWGDYYHPDTPNRLVARVHNIGCAPCRNASVEFRVMSFRAGGGTTLIGTAPVMNIDPGHHAFAFRDWHFPSTLVHECIKVRADSAADPADPFGASIAADDNQAQRNLDPLFAAPASDEMPEPFAIERTFMIRNELEERAVLGITLPKRLFSSQHIRPEILDREALRRISLEPGQERAVNVRFRIDPHAKLGEKLHFPIAVRRLRPDRAVVGGVTLTVEVATAHLAGHVVSRGFVRFTEGRVTIENIKQKNLTYTTEVDHKGFFSFRDIVPGPYRILVECEEGLARGAVFAMPNRLTKKVLYLRRFVRVVGGFLKDRKGELLAHTTVTVKDTHDNVSYLVHTDAKGIYRIPDIRPGEYELVTPDKGEAAPRVIRLDYVSAGNGKNGEFRAALELEEPLDELELVV